jgi:hypothetical protein
MGLFDMMRWELSGAAALARATLRRQGKQLKAAAYSALQPSRSRRMVQVKDQQRIAPYALKQTIGMSAYPQHANVASLFEPGADFRCFSQLRNGNLYARFQRSRNTNAKLFTAELGGPSNIQQGASRIGNDHGDRNLAKASRTSFSSAKPLASASSIAFSSSAVAKKTPARRASMSRACSASSS